MFQAIHCRILTLPNCFEAESQRACRSLALSWHSCELSGVRASIQIIPLRSETSQMVETTFQLSTGIHRASFFHWQHVHMLEIKTVIWTTFSVIHSDSVPLLLRTCMCYPTIPHLLATGTYKLYSYLPGTWHKISSNTVRNCEMRLSSVCQYDQYATWIRKSFCSHITCTKDTWSHFL